MKKLFAATIAAAALAIAGAGTAQASQLVQNAGFETGDFTSWSLSGNTSFTSVAAAPAPGYDGISVVSGDSLGNYSAYLGPVGSTGTLSQTLQTVAGTTYTLSFDLANEGFSPNSFLAIVNGGTILNISNVNPSVTNFTLGSTTYHILDYNQYQQSFVATSANTTLSFTYEQSPSYWVLDTVQLVGQAVPEPTTWAMMLVCFGAIGLGLRGSLRRKALTA